MKSCGRKEESISFVTNFKLVRFPIEAMMILKICFTVTWFTLLVQCDHSFSKIIPLTQNTKLLTDDSSALPISTEFDSAEWDEEDVTSNRGYGTNSSNSGPTVVTACGTYQGRYGGNKKGCKYERFLGIPFAQPPAGPLRFRQPVPADCMQDMEYQATQYGPPCMQPRKKALDSSKMEPSEDCLYLNIYRPPNTGPNDNYPVLIYIHESYFLYGSAAQPELDGGCLASMGKIIVVTCNYRLGAFGFLNGGSAAIDGNMGALDAAACNLFVKENIQYFGGDPDKVTAGGHGSGGIIAVSALIEPLIPKDFVRGVMVMSTYFNQQTIKDSPLIALMKSNVFLKLIGCNDPSTNDTDRSDEKTLAFSPTELACVQSADADTLAEASDKFYFYDGNGICSHSQLSINYIRMSYHEQLRRGMFRRDRYIFAGNVITEFKKSLIGSRAETKEEGAKVITEKVKPIILDQRWENIVKIIKYYLGFIGKDDSFAVGQRTTLALNIVCYGCLTDEVIRYMSLFGNKVFGYQYSYVASCDKDDPKRIYGPYHLDDVYFGFGEPFRARKKYSDYDREVSKAVIGIWSDFVSQKKMQWPAYDKKNRFIGIIQGDKKSNTYISSPYSDVCQDLNN